MREKRDKREKGGGVTPVALALLRSAFYPLLVHRPAVALHASSPHSVALMQLRFASLTVTSL